jgi:hypothetical protein
MVCGDGLGFSMGLEVSFWVGGLYPSKARSCDICLSIPFHD